jgi:hypothetical protein
VSDADMMSKTTDYANLADWGAVALSVLVESLAPRFASVAAASALK